MTEKARLHLKHEMLVGGLSNALFNGVIAWSMLRNGPPMSWWGDNSFVADIIATAFILPFIVALIVIPIHKRKLANGKLDTMNFGTHSRLQSWVNRLPLSTLANAFWFGIAGLCIAAPPPLLGFFAVGVDQIVPLHYAIFKGIWAGLMAAVLVVPMVMSALREPADLGLGNTASPN